MPSDEGEGRAWRKIKFIFISVSEWIFSPFWLMCPHNPHQIFTDKDDDSPRARLAHQLCHARVLSPEFRFSRHRYTGMRHEAWLMPRTPEMSTYKFVAVAKGLTVRLKKKVYMWIELRIERTTVATLFFFFFFWNILFSFWWRFNHSLSRFHSNYMYSSLTHSRSMPMPIVMHIYVPIGRKIHTAKRAQHQVPTTAAAYCEQTITQNMPMIALISHEIRTIIVFIATEKKAKIIRATASTVLWCVWNEKWRA